MGQELSAQGGLAGSVVLLGEGTILAVGGSADPVAVGAVADLPSGARAVVFGHEGFVRAAASTAANRTLLQTWIPMETALRLGPIDPGRWGPSSDGVPAARAKGFGPRLLDDVRVLFVEQGAVDDRSVAAIEEWIAAGDGRTLVVAGPVWGWCQLHPSERFPDDHLANRLLTPFGLALGDAMVEGPYLTGDGAPSELGLRGALAALQGLRSGRARRLAEATIEAAVPVLRLHPREQESVLAAHAGERVQARVTADHLSRCCVESVRAHSSAETFPGSVHAGAQPCSRTVDVDCSRAGWTSTGLYARPGYPITVNVVGGVASGCRVRVGAHSDTLWQADTWRRFPEITLEGPLAPETTTVASAFGGPVYLVVPRGVRGRLSVTIDGAIAAPMHVRGRPVDPSWNDPSVTPAPWAELVGDLCALTIPSAAVRSLTDPEAVVRFWDDVVGAAHEFYAEPPRARGQRFCIDVQISNGYMHAGYPIMTHDDVAAQIVDLSALRGPDGNAMWGFFHEIGHNFQRPQWTWDGTGEVTNNLFSLFANERFNGTWDERELAEQRSHDQMTPHAHERRMHAHHRAGAPYEEWTKDPWKGLSTFFELRREFGWEPFTEVFASYHERPKDDPIDDQAKRDSFVARFNAVVGRDVSSRFTADGVPLTSASVGTTAVQPRRRRRLGLF